MAWISCRVGGVLLGRGLEVVALDEDRPAESLADRRGQDRGHVFGRPLVGVAHLAPGDLEDEGPGVDRPGGPEDGPGRIVGHHAEVHRRDGEKLGDLAPAPGRVELVDGGRPDAQGLGRLPDDPAGGGLRFRLAEDGLADEAVHAAGEPRFTLDRQAVPGFFDDAGQDGEQTFDVGFRHDPAFVPYRFFRPKIPPLMKSPAPRTNPKLYQPPLLWTS